MLVQELVGKIDTKQTPIYFYDFPKEKFDYFYCIITTLEELAVLRNRKPANIIKEELGVHFLNTYINQIYDDYLRKNPISVEDTCTLLSPKCSVPKNKMIEGYVLFAIFHEIGHWQHLINSGLSRVDYWMKYEKSRDNLWIEFQMKYNFAPKNYKQTVLAYRS